MRHISEHGLKFIEGFEGFRDHIYNDGTGVMTIGYGTTSSVVNPLPSHVTRDEAEHLLREAVAKMCEPVIHGLGINFTQNQFDALCSFVYNLGPGILGAEHTIGHLLREHNLEGAAQSMLLYSDPGTAVHAGLLRRREAERALFLKH